MQLFWCSGTTILLFLFSICIVMPKQDFTCYYTQFFIHVVPFELCCYLSLSWFFRVF